MKLATAARAFVLPALLCLLALVASTVPAHAARYQCSDFATAEQVREAYRPGATYLDRDGDGHACEKQFNVNVRERPVQKPLQSAPREKRRGDKS